MITHDEVVNIGIRANVCSVEMDQEKLSDFLLRLQAVKKQACAFLRRIALCGWSGMAEKNGREYLENQREQYQG